MIALPYLGKLSLQIRTRINRVIKSKLPHCNFWIAFRSKCKFINFITFQDKIPIFLRSGIVYQFKCGGCNATLYGKTKRYFKERMCEDLGVSALTGKRVNGYNDSAINEHHLFYNYSSCLDTTMTWVDWSDCSPLISHRYCFIKWMVVFLFIGLNLVACHFLTFDWCKMLNGSVEFSFNIFFLRITVASVETLENWRWSK